MGRGRTFSREFKLEAIKLFTEFDVAVLQVMCEALGVSRGCFYAWLIRPRSQHSLSDEALGAQVHQRFLRSERTYGARSVWNDDLEQGQTSGLHRIKWLTRE